MLKINTVQLTTLTSYKKINSQESPASSKAQTQQTFFPENFEKDIPTDQNLKHEVCSSITRPHTVKVEPNLIKKTIENFIISKKNFINNLIESRSKHVQRFIVIGLIIFVAWISLVFLFSFFLFAQALIPGIFLGILTYALSLRKKLKKEEPFLVQQHALKQSLSDFTSLRSIFERELARSPSKSHHDYLEKKFSAIYKSNTLLKQYICARNNSLLSLRRPSVFKP